MEIKKNVGKCGGDEIMYESVYKRIFEICRNISILNLRKPLKFLQVSYIIVHIDTHIHISTTIEIFFIRFLRNILPHLPPNQVKSKNQTHEYLHKIFNMSPTARIFTRLQSRISSFHRSDT